MGAQAPPADISGSALPQAIPLVLWSLPEPPRLILTQEDVDAALTQVMEEHSAAAVSVATVERGQLSQAGAWGWAVKNQQEMTPDTKVRVASISKVVVAMCDMSMAEEGLIVVAAAIDGVSGEVVAGPDLVSRGFVYVRENEEMMEGARRTVLTSLSQCKLTGYRDWSAIKNRIRDDLADYIYARTRRRPMILPVIEEVG